MRIKKFYQALVPKSSEISLVEGSNIFLVHETNSLSEMPVLKECFLGSEGNFMQMLKFANENKLQIATVNKTLELQHLVGTDIGDNEIEYEKCLTGLFAAYAGPNESFYESNKRDNGKYLVSNYQGSREYRLEIPEEVRREKNVTILASHRIKDGKPTIEFEKTRTGVLFHLLDASIISYQKRLENECFEIDKNDNIKVVPQEGIPSKTFKAFDTGWTFNVRDSSWMGFVTHAYKTAWILSINELNSGFNPQDKYPFYLEYTGI